MIDLKRQTLPVERKAGQRILGHQCSLNSEYGPPFFIGGLRRAGNSTSSWPGGPLRDPQLNSQSLYEGEEKCFIFIYITCSKDGSGFICSCSLRKA